MVGMVDISKKPAVPRMASASGFISLKPDTLRRIRSGKVPKGDVLSVAQTAAIMAVKRTPELVPLAHQIPVTGIDVGFRMERNGVRVVVGVRSTAGTGVEMEALVGVASALRTIWDMVKGLEKDRAGQYPTTSIGDVRVVRKVKG